MKEKSVLPVLFAVVMLVFVLFLVWYIPAAGQRRFQLEDTRKSIETSLGRERKQQHEYDETVAAIPETAAELNRVTPLAEATKEEVKALKKERKELRNEKKVLEGGSVSDSQEGTDDE